MICPYCNEEITFAEAQDREIVFGGDNNTELCHIKCKEHEQEENA